MDKEKEEALDVAREGEEGGSPGQGWSFEAVEITGREEVRGENRGRAVVCFYGGQSSSLKMLDPPSPKGSKAQTNEKNKEKCNRTPEVHTRKILRE
jgi:hypothetical protein